MNCPCCGFPCQLVDVYIKSSDHIGPYDTVLEWECFNPKCPWGQSGE